MNAPRRPDGPPVRGGLPYSAIAHLAEDVKPFVAMARALRERGLSAPQIHAADLNEGLVLLEDLGTEGVVEGDPPAPVEERYAAAVDVLVALHRQPAAATLPVAPGVEYRLPPYDIDAFLIEAELLLDWYMPHRDGFVTAAARSEFTALWREALSHAYDQPADLGAARLSFAQPAVAARAGGDRARRHPRLPGCPDGARALRSRLAAAGRARRCARRRWRSRCSAAT